MNKFILGVIFLVSALFSADSFTFKKANNTKEVMSNLQKSHSKQGLKAKQYSKVRAYKVFYVSDFVFDSNTDELTGIYNGGQLLFYLAYNKVQGDPTIFLSKNILQNYGCDYIAQQVADCNFDLYHTRVGRNTQNIVHQTAAKMLQKKHQDA